jgi:uncharacterized protein (UPF0248 family)
MRKENPLHRLLTRLRWQLFNSKIIDYQVTYINRPQNITINSSDIANILKGSILLEDGETQIPFHRIMLVTRIRFVGSMREETIMYKKDRLNKKVGIEDGEVVRC